MRWRTQSSTALSARVRAAAAGLPRVLVWAEWRAPRAWSLSRTRRALTLRHPPSITPTHPHTCALPYRPTHPPAHRQACTSTSSTALRCWRWRRGAPPPTSLLRIACTTPWPPPSGGWVGGVGEGGRKVSLRAHAWVKRGGREAGQQSARRAARSTAPVPLACVPHIALNASGLPSRPELLEHAERPRLWPCSSTFARWRSGSRTTPSACCRCGHAPRRRLRGAHWSLPAAAGFGTGATELLSAPMSHPMPPCPHSCAPAYWQTPIPRHEGGR